MAARPSPSNPAPVDFGPNVIVLDPTMSQSAIASKISTIYATQSQDRDQSHAHEMGPNRFAIFFKPGTYGLAVDVGYYTTVHGLGKAPGEVTITGAVQSLAEPPDGLALNSFWRGVENLTINSALNIWAVSQATYMRRVHVQGSLDLCDSRFNYTNKNYSSGGFIADTVVDGEVRSGTQQQFLTRNCTLNKWTGDVWNMVFIGDTGYFPIGQWPTHAYTVVGQTPVMREKPFLSCDDNGVYSVQVPGIRRNVPEGWYQPTTSWQDSAAPISTLPITAFYIAHAGSDTTDTLNAALQTGYNVIFTPGVYHLSGSINVRWQNTVLLGLGMATLVPDSDNPVLVIDDVDGVTVCGIIIDAGATAPAQGQSLLVVGPSATNRADHSSNPTVLLDVCCRVGGASVGSTSTQSCVTINSNNVILDNAWIWRADHGLDNTVGWDINKAANGVIVNGDNVIAYGLFVEHFEQYQTIWNGNGGQVFFYQSEIPYDIPSQVAWGGPADNVKGYASYKVSGSVETHSAQGLGVYCYFKDAVVQMDSAIEAPTEKQGVTLQHMVTFWLDGKTGSSINHVVNDEGATVTQDSRKAQI